MLWAKNLLFLSLVGGGAATLAARLLPPRQPTPLTRYANDAVRDDGFRASVAKLDAAFADRWAAAGLTPAGPADDLVVARRLALGLAGTVPSLEEVRQFEALPPGERLAWWVDHLLADRRAHDFLAERLARAAVGTEDGPFLLFRRRRFVTWLADQVGANRPYDDLVRELITGEGVWTGKPAANFVTATSQQDKENAPDPVRLAGRVTRAFLGLRLDCAECHDHPFAAWKQSDFEGFAAFFGQTHVTFRGVTDGGGEFTVEDRRTRQPRTPAPAVPSHAELLPADGTRRERLAAWVTHPRNPYFARAAVNRVWAVVTGRPLVEPVDNLEVDDPHPALAVLADDFAGHGFDLHRLVRVIAASRAAGLDGVAGSREPTAEDEKAWAVFPLTRLRPEQVAGGVAQAASVTTLDARTHILFRLIRSGEQNEFVTRYGDGGADEFDARGGTIPQRLLLMNGKLVRERIAGTPLNASARIGWMAADDRAAVEAAYLACLTRRPTPAEAEHFERRLADPELPREQRMEDLYWALVNSTEFSWNH
jgi:hypothetical protein